MSDKHRILSDIKCDLCGSDEIKVVFNSPIKLTQPDDISAYLASTDRYESYGRIVKCKNCGLVFTSPRPAEGLIKESYKRVVDEDYMREDESRAINGYLCLATIKKFVKKGRLLDIGCATGYFLNAARLDFEVMGLEPSQWAAVYARERLSLEVINASIPDENTARIPDESFDVVSMVDVIEHLTSPSASIYEINRLLKMDGLLYIVTPNIRSISALIMGRKWWGLRPAHLYYFTPLTIKKLLAMNGFETVYMKSYGRIFRLKYWLTRIRSYNGWLYKIINRLIKFLKVEEKFVYINTRDSMEICARKIKKV